MLSLFAVILSLSPTPGVPMQDPEWTHFGQTGGHVMFVRGGPETHSGSRELAMAVAPPPGRTHDGKPLGFFIVFGTVDCMAWTLRQGSVQYFGTDGRIFDQDWSEDPAAPIVPGSATETAAKVKCRGQVLVAQPIEQSRIVETAARLR